MTAANSVGQNAEISANYPKPNINVTPLIDVLLVVLIIFMVVSPLKPARFLTKVPSKPDQSQNHPEIFGQRVHLISVVRRLLNILRDEEKQVSTILSF